MDSNIIVSLYGVISMVIYITVSVQHHNMDLWSALTRSLTISYGDGGYSNGCTIYYYYLLNHVLDTESIKTPILLM